MKKFNFNGLMMRKHDYMNLYNRATSGTNLVLRDDSVVELKSRGWGSKED